jgi:hypothetical protein
MTRTKRIYNRRPWLIKTHWIDFPWLQYKQLFRKSCCRNCAWRDYKIRQKYEILKKRYWTDQIRSYPMLV